MGRLRNLASKFPGTYTEFDGIEEAATRLQAKYDTGDYSTEEMTAMAEGQNLTIVIKEADPTEPKKLYQRLSDSQDPGDPLLAFHVAPLAEEGQFVAVLPSTTVARTKQYMMAEIARVMD
jgi:hypothetical protein